MYTLRSRGRWRVTLIVLQLFPVERAHSVACARGLNEPHILSDMLAKRKFKISCFLAKLFET